jgi:hypothetical protein
VELSIDIDVAGITKAAKALIKINSASLTEAAVKAVNASATSAYALAQEHMLANINLPPAYVDSQMRLDPAIPGRPEATITALRRGVRGTTLAPSYGATPSSAAVRWPNGSFKPGAYGRNPRDRSKALLWKPRTGNAALGVPVNMKATGFDVSVRRGVPAHFSQSASGNHYSFLIPVRGYLLAVSRQRGRHGKGSLEALRGPSPWQLFRHVIPVITGQVEADLTQRISDEVDFLVGEAFEGVL